MPGDRPSQHGHSSDPSTTFSGPSFLNVSTSLRSVMVILLRPPPRLRQGVPLLTNKTQKNLSPAAASPSLSGVEGKHYCGAERRHPRAPAEPCNSAVTKRSDPTGMARRN